MENKSKILLTGTILSIIIGVEAIIVCGYAVLKLFLFWWNSPKSAPEQLLFILTFTNVILIFVPIILFLLCLIIFELTTALISFITNKKLWTIAHIMSLVVLSPITFIVSEIPYLQSIPAYFSFGFIIVVALRIVGYFKQKRMNIAKCESST